MRDVSGSVVCKRNIDALPMSIECSVVVCCSLLSLCVLAQ